MHQQYPLSQLSASEFLSGNSKIVLPPVRLGLFRSVSGGDRLREASGKFQPGTCRNFPYKN